MKSSLLARNSKYYLGLPVFVFFASIFTTASADQYKIGVVDAMAVLEQSPQADKMTTQLRQEFEDRNRKIIEMQKRLTDMNERLTNDAAVMSDTERNKMEREIYLMKRDLQRAEDQYREDLSFRRNEILSALQDEIVKAIQTVSKQNNFDIVLTSGVNWASQKINITPMVVDYLKKQEKPE